MDIPSEINRILLWTAIAEAEKTDLHEAFFIHPAIVVDFPYISSPMIVE